MWMPFKGLEVCFGQNYDRKTSTHMQGHTDKAATLCSSSGKLIKYDYI